MMTLLRTKALRYSLYIFTATIGLNGILPSLASADSSYSAQSTSNSAYQQLLDDDFNRADEVQQGSENDGQRGGRSGDLRNEAAKEASREMGRDVVRRMDDRHKSRMLNRYREALRGELLYKYALANQGDRQPRMYGYVMATREGRDSSQNYCREIEMDLIYDNQRHFERSVSCLFADGQWHPTPANEVDFSQSGGSPRPPRPPTPGDGRGGWLPPPQN
jgi:surface antigen